jgi:hypothetical protein
MVVVLVVIEQRRQVAFEAHSPAKRVRERQSAGHRVGHMCARTQPECSERFTVGSGEAAHLFRRLGARTLKILS